MNKATYWKGLFPALFLLSILSNFSFAQVANPTETGIRYLTQNLDDLALSETDLADVKVKNIVVTQHNKVTHLYLHQQHAGIPVHNAILNLNILENGEVLSVGNRFVSNLAAEVNTTSPSLTMEQAITAVMDQFDLPGERQFRLTESRNPHEAVFDPAGLALEPIKVKLVYQPMPDQSVRLAWNVIFYELDAQNWWNVRVDALDAKILDYHNQVIHCEFGAPQDNCEEEQAIHFQHADTEHQFNMPPPANNVYRAFPLTVESPNHGDFILHESPADPVASPFGWHDTDGIPGHEYTITRGNNVHAYHDIFNQNMSVGGEPDGGDSLVFDFPFEITQNRPYTQLDAATTNLFFWNNLTHDVWYHYGFDEQAGNFQANNYGNGGIGGDHVRAEALDGSGTNNANFGTPDDGSNPRMQMYLWGGSLEDNEDTGLQVTAPDSVGGYYEYLRGQFGGDIPPFETPITGRVVLANDSIGNFADACSQILNPDSLVGNIAMIDRGDCEFGFKCLAAENAGAIAVIICNNVEDDIIAMGAGAVGNQVTIPSIMVSLQDCNRLKMGLPGLEVSLSQPDFTVPLPGPTGRDSDFDNGIIVHEYAHGISNRLTGGPDASGCLNNVEQAGEGWSDWFGLVMTTKPGMTAEQARGIGTYASGESPSGQGIRTYPYSRDMNINPHTYGAIEGEEQVHFIGSVWCVMIWDLFWNLVDEYGYDPDLYTGTGGNNLAMQLVLDGLKMQPCSPTFIDSRDAILKADSVNNDAANACLIWETFARRGLGLSAEPGGMEAFNTPILCTNVVAVNKTTVSEANAGEVIDYELEIANGTAEDVVNGILADQLPEGTTYIEGSASCNSSYSNGVLTLQLGDIPSGTIKTCRYQLRLPDAPFSEVAFEDGFETGPGNWVVMHPVGNNNWILTVARKNSGFRALHAPNEDQISDQQLIIEEPFDLSGPTAGLSFWHYYDTEEFRDGGVVEISTDGETWEDLGDHILLNGYDSPLVEGNGNPLEGRPAFHGASNAWIQTIIDLSDFTGGTAKIRFRLGCDDSRAREGWYVDDIRFFDAFHPATNTACLATDEEDICSSVSTIVVALPVSTAEAELDAAVNLFPNPTTGAVTVEVSDGFTGDLQLDVLNIAGQQLLNRSYSDLPQETIDLASFGPGIYLIQLRTEDAVITKRLVVQ